MALATANAVQKSLSQDGFTVLRNYLSHININRLGATFAENAPSRRLTTCPPAVKQLFDNQKFRNALNLVCGPSFHIVRMIYFNKSTDRRWFVPWHQDRTIAVRGYSDAMSYSKWTLKQNVWHVEPPIDLLERMLTVRIHLDETTEVDGPLEMMVGSHRQGRMTQGQIKEHITNEKSHQCMAMPGDVLIMRPLLVHRSTRGSGRRRRIIHLELSPDQLPSPLEWHSRTQIFH